jgi:hypothetical protein
VSPDNRLSRLEHLLPDPGCPGCRDRRRPPVLVEANRLADGSVLLRYKEPEACGLCGVVPEDVVKVVLSIVDTQGGSLGFAGRQPEP